MAFMGMVDKPDLEEYAKLLDEYAQARFRLDTVKMLYDEAQARSLQQAAKAHVKTRDYDYIKILGNNAEDEKLLSEFRKEIISSNKYLNQISGKIKVWEAKKDLYRSDTFLERRI